MASAWTHRLKNIAFIASVFCIVRFLYVSLYLVIVRVVCKRCDSLKQTSDRSQNLLEDYEACFVCKMTSLCVTPSKSDADSDNSKVRRGG